MGYQIEENRMQKMFLAIYKPVNMIWRSNRKVKPKIRQINRNFKLSDSCHRFRPMRNKFENIKQQEMM